MSDRDTTNRKEQEFAAPSFGPATCVVTIEEFVTPYCGTLTAHNVVSLASNPAFAARARSSPEVPEALLTWRASDGRATFDILRNERLVIFNALGPPNVKGGSHGKRASKRERRAEIRNVAVFKILANLKPFQSRFESIVTASQFVTSCLRE